MESEDTEEGYTNGFGEVEGEDAEAEDEESWEQVGPKKKSVFTRKVWRLFSTHFTEYFLKYHQI